MGIFEKLNKKKAEAQMNECKKHAIGYGYQLIEFDKNFDGEKNADLIAAQKAITDKPTDINKEKVENARNKYAKYLSAHERSRFSVAGLVRVMIMEKNDYALRKWQEEKWIEEQAANRRNGQTAGNRKAPRKIQFATETHVLSNSENNPKPRVNERPSNPKTLLEYLKAGKYSDFRSNIFHDTDVEQKKACWSFLISSLKSAADKNLFRDCLSCLGELMKRLGKDLPKQELGKGLDESIVNNYLRFGGDQNVMFQLEADFDLNLYTDLLKKNITFSNSRVDPDFVADDAKTIKGIQIRKDPTDGVDGNNLQIIIKYLDEKQRSCMISDRSNRKK